ncbi:uncharacterized protein LOC112458220 isoform X1 [Temnothorax curvispinosus]|uniref:Uncharacterized protein LOC112458220 isoform X1 n=1 Tax=Temnothorax curvispinosus TaxID=300111 RepID=A0A6J1Q5J6_9HYME|nr:uncharacterized protein LOC112458220 isoform X1 [Temnothorax curvispinosus]
MYKILNIISGLFFYLYVFQFLCFLRLLKSLNLSDDDIDNLQDLWQAKIEVDKSSTSINSTSNTSSSTCHAHALSNNIYLKKVLSKPLIQALCEIVAKKPTDPVGYLGHWLLHYKINEGRAVQQKERESELSINMKKLKLQKVEDNDLFIERKDEEEHGEDRTYTGGSIHPIELCPA